MAIKKEIRISIPKEDKIVADLAVKAFGGKPKIYSHVNDDKNNTIDILSVIDKPFKNVTSYSTIGLNAYEVMTIENNIPLSIEIVGACFNKYEKFPNVLATCAFNIINSNFKCSFGEVFKDIIKMYYKNLSMKHVLFCTPFLWENKLTTIEFEHNKTAWLLALPISQKELEFLDQEGVEKLLDSFEMKNIDIFDLNRESVF